MSEKTVHEEIEQRDTCGTFLLVPDLTKDLYVSALHISPAGIKGKVHTKRKCAGQKLVPDFYCLYCFLFLAKEPSFSPDVGSTPSISCQQPS